VGVSPYSTRVRRYMRERPRKIKRSWESEFLRAGW